MKKFGDRGENYKCELISELEDGRITTYTQGAFTDLCRGPHLMTTAPIKAIKLMSVAGAYWRGHEDRKMMTRIYGITFPKKKMLDEYLAMLEEAKKRDHRKIGKEMDLFMFSGCRRGLRCACVCRNSCVVSRHVTIIRRLSLPRSVTSCCISLPATMQNMVKIRSSLFIRPKKERSTS